MKKTELIGISIFVILVVIYTASFLSGSDNKTKVIKCSEACFELGENNWTFPGGPIPIDDQNLFQNEEECISACRLKLKK